MPTRERQGDGRSDGATVTHRNKEGVFRNPISELMKTEVNQRHDIIQQSTPEGRAQGRAQAHKGVVLLGTGDT